MCAHALNIVGLKRVVFGGRNDKFGGHGSILCLHKLSNIETKQTDDQSHIEASIALLQEFYEHGNAKISVEKRQRK